MEQDLQTDVVVVNDTKIDLTPDSTDYEQIAALRNLEWVHSELEKPCMLCGLASHECCGWRSEGDDFVCDECYRLLISRDAVFAAKFPPINEQSDGALDGDKDIGGLG